MRFQLSFHIPYFVLMPSPPATKLVRNWNDLSFLPTSKVDNKRYAMYRAMFSFVICGSDHRRWTGYAFADDNKNDDDMLDDDDELDYQIDPIASVDEGPFLMLDDQINPRQYFLRVLDLRMEAILKEWENIVRFMEYSIEDCIYSVFRHHPLDHSFLPMLTLYSGKHPCQASRFRSVSQI